MGLPDSPPSTPLSTPARHSGRAPFPKPNTSLPDTPPSNRKPAASGSSHHSPSSSIDSSWFEVDTIDEEETEGLEAGLGRLQIGSLKQETDPSHKTSGGSSLNPEEQQFQEPILRLVTYPGASGRSVECIHLTCPHDNPRPTQNRFVLFPIKYHEVRIINNRQCQPLHQRT